MTRSGIGGLVGLPVPPAARGDAGRGDPSPRPRDRLPHGLGAWTRGTMRLRGGIGPLALVWRSGMETIRQAKDVSEGDVAIKNDAASIRQDFIRSLFFSLAKFPGVAT